MSDSSPAPGRKRLVLVGLAVGWLLLGLVWSLASPPGSSPDDDFHLGSIWCAWGSEATGCVTGQVGDTRVEVRVPALTHAFSNCVALKPDQSAACQFQDAGPPPVTANTGLYPPGFYAFLRTFATDELGPSIVTMRMAVWTVCSLLWAALLALIPAKSRERVLVAVLAAMVPLGLYVSASTNPSGLVVTGVPVAVLAVVFAPDAGRGRGWVIAALAGVAGLAAALSRSDAPFFLALGLAAAFVMRFRDLRDLRRWWPAPLTLTASILVGLAAAGTQTGNISGGLPGADAAEAAGPSIGSVVLRLPFYVVGEFATTLGYMDVPMPALVWAPVAAAMAGLGLLGLASWRLEKGLAVLMLVGAQVVGLVYLQINSSCCTVQARYLLPVTVMWMAMLAVVPAGRAAWRLNRAQAWALWAALAGSQSLALRQVLLRYTVGLGSPDEYGLFPQPQWWWGLPVSPWVVWLMGTVLFGLVLGWALHAIVASDRAGRLVQSPG